MQRAIWKGLLLAACGKLISWVLLFQSLKCSDFGDGWLSHSQATPCAEVTNYNLFLTRKIISEICNV